MTKVWRFLAAVLPALYLTACVTVEKPKTSEQSRLAVSSSWSAPMRYTASSRFFIRKQFAEKYQSVTPELKAAYALYQDALKNDLQQNGYVFTNPDNANFEIGYAMALAKDVNDEVIIREIGISPGLRQVDDLAKASLVIFVRDRLSQQLVWRGIAQGFVQPALSDEQRKANAQTVIATIMAQFYGN